MCDTMVLVEPGRVLFAKNSDRDPNEAQLLEWQPAASHPPGAMVRCTYLGIPQAGRTHAVLLSRPFWMWGAEMGTNEHGLTIGNEAVFTREPYADTGLTGMDLLRLTLERAADASEAITVLADLLDTHGQGGGCGHEDRGFTYHNSFLIADPAGAVVLETAGRRWAVEEVTAGARSISNGLTIEPFASQFADRVRTRVSACRARRAITEAGVTAAIGPADLAAVLRSHGKDVAPDYSLVNGAMAAPCMHAGGILAASQTTASWISELTRERSHHWATATAAPCTSLFKPVAVDEPVHVGPAPTDRADNVSLWWRHERLHRAVVRDPVELFPRFVPERDEIERGWFAHPVASSGAFAEADACTARWIGQVAGNRRDTRPWYVQGYWRARDRRAGLLRRDAVSNAESGASSGAPR
jgi:secernin